MQPIGFKVEHRCPSCTTSLASCTQRVLTEFFSNHLTEKKITGLSTNLNVKYNCKHWGIVKALDLNWEAKSLHCRIEIDRKISRLQGISNCYCIFESSRIKWKERFKGCTRIG